MVKVTDISSTTHTFADQLKNPPKHLVEATKQCIELVPDILDYLPKEPEYTVRFTLSDANSQLANAIRRCLVDEIPTYALTFDLLVDQYGEYLDSITKLDTNDKYIFGQCENLLKKIEAIPMRQDISDPDKWLVSLDVANTTNELIDIHSSDFLVKRNGKIVPVDNLMFSHYVLTRLRPHSYLKIKDIKIVRGISMDNPNKFKYLSEVYYKIDAEPMHKVDKQFVGVSSMNSDYSKFIMGYTTYRNCVPKFDPIKRACVVLVERLVAIQNEWEKIKPDQETPDELKSSDKINKYKVGQIHVIEITGENYTLANALYYYVYKEVPDIDFATGGVKHIEKRIAVIKIKHNNYYKIFTNAIRKLIADIETINSAFT